MMLDLPRFPRLLRFGQLLPALLVLIFAHGSVLALPSIPTNGDQVIERLPGHSDPAQQKLRQLRQQLSADPQNLGLAVDLAQRFIDTARSSADPRYLGYAQAALAPWWHSATAPDAVRILRAILRQSTHQFGPALADLDVVLRHDSRQPQAWLTRATILQVQGEYGAAKQSCAHLFGLADNLVTQTCLHSVASLNGNAANSYRHLLQSLRQQPDAAPALQLWGLTLLGEMAHRLGDLRAAESHFEQALRATPDAGQDSYLLAAYADLLLEQQRSAQVVALLRDQTKADNLLLRYALALQQQGSTRAAVSIAHLAERFDAATRRGDQVHQREQARFALTLQHDPAAALRLAQQNWLV